MSNFLFNSLWPGLVIWTVLYISDYSLTLKCARLYKTGASDKIAIEGSYEITPFFQRDIDTLKPVSRRFLFMLLVNAILLATVWLFTRQSASPLYNFVLGTLILSQLTIHVRHLRNLALFRGMINSDAVRGRIQYSRKFSLSMSASELFAFSGLWFLVFVFTTSWFALGGAVACLSIAVKHRRLMYQLASTATNQKPAPVA
jgi:hypothetical protein